jgi:hypothetical protein
LVEYIENYFADHWSNKRHIDHCLEGEIVSELESGEIFVLTQGMSFIVSDDLSSHRSLSLVLCKCFRDILAKVNLPGLERELLENKVFCFLTIVY